MTRAGTPVQPSCVPSLLNSVLQAFALLFSSETANIFIAMVNGLLFCMCSLVSIVLPATSPFSPICVTVMSKPREPKCSCGVNRQVVLCAAGESRQIGPWVVPCFFPRAVLLLCYPCVTIQKLFAGSGDERCLLFHVPGRTAGVGGVSTHPVMLQSHKTFMKGFDV